MNNEGTVQHPNGLPFEQTMSHEREVLRSLGVTIHDALKHPVFQGETDGIRNETEMKANITLAYRHIEDAIMRLGKAIQAFDGGKSIYQK